MVSVTDCCQQLSNVPQLNAAGASPWRCPAGLLSTVLAEGDVLFLGRQDYVVRSVRTDTKVETWNATFSKLYMMSRDAGSIKDFLQHGAAPTAGSAAAAAGMSDTAALRHSCLAHSRNCHAWHGVPPLQTEQRGLVLLAACHVVI